MKKKILFICVHNSARSQMAEAWLNETCGESFEAQSAGLEPGVINPLAEVGIDLSQKKTQAVFDVWKSGQLFQYVITVCSDADAQGCPIVPGVATRLHWPFRDPSQLTGSDDEKMAEVRKIRDAIRERIERWCGEGSGEQGAGSEQLQTPNAQG